VTEHVNTKTGELLDPDDIVARAREIDGEIVRQDERIREVTADLKALKEGREDLVAELRKVIRPVPLFDKPPAAPSLYDNTQVSITGPDGVTHDVTEGMKRVEAMGRKGGRA
jgi:hypothetical protein